MKRLLLLATVVSLLGVRVQSAPVKPKAGPGFANRIETYLKPYLEFHTFNGVILVAKGDSILFQRGYGPANAEFGIANTPETRFPIASITKRFTNVILQKLFAKELLSPDDTLSKWVPDFPSAEKITVGHLMAHRSGLRDPAHLRGITRRSLSSGEVVELLESSSIVSEPGKVYSYTTANYAILGHIIERVTGRSWPEVVEELVYEPARMSDSGELTTLSVVPRLASGYMPDPLWRGLAVASPEDMSWKIAGGSSYSTARDLMRFGRALYDGTLLPKELAAELFPTSKLGERRMLSSSGAFPGASANHLYFPDDDVTVVVLSNNSATVAGRISDAVARMQFGEQVEAPVIKLAKDPHSIDPRALGSYGVTGRPWTFIVELQQERPVMKWTPTRQSALLRISDDTWFEPYDWALLTFKFDDEGNLAEGSFTLPGSDPLPVVRQSDR